MPIFEYQCKKCGKTFEKLVLARGQKSPECPDCGAKQVEQQLSRFSSATSSSGGTRSCAPGTPT